MKEKIRNFVKINIGLIIFILINILIENIYATCTCNIDLALSETMLKKNEKFTVDVNVSDIESEIGIMVFGATIDYDRNSLYIESIEGLNNWETPSIGSSFNEENGKIAITKSGFGKENETIIRITFGVNDESKKELKVTLKDISLSDGTGVTRVEDITKNVTVKNGSNNSNKSGGKGVITAIVVLLILVVIIYKNKKK